ncbi:hypothetical protein SAMN05421810_10626 [Amycolatopsis arida]|uniref:Uncharacterized protein n=2 Tax=Amycolatopsis arida TaxID=587909 RepID=A0A1I5XFN1_9PSEU|nr:hypothetical protein CLV69_102595 [Amycolatopsis arida]SFQ30626.1 hypothetical protein SAMN05421810_10626 [Amycolatopsis arida]
MSVKALLAALVAVVAATLPSPAAADDGSRLVAITDQRYDNHAAARIRLLDPDVADWGSAAAQRWTWHPTSNNGFGGLTGAWGLPTDVKLRKDRAGAYVAVVSDSRGLAALVTYPGGRRVWGVNAGAPSNPHSVELLPDGNVAVAASHGNFVRVYTASQGASSARYTQYTLADAHGVHWDPARRVLWALGKTELVALTVGGTAAAPTLTRSHAWALPTSGGHDLAPALEDDDVLWISTSSHVYRYSKSRDAAVATYPLATVKSVSSMPNGQQVRTAPKAGCRTGWCTDTVTFRGPDFTRTRPGAQIYKARVWSSRYR